jgi:hypothetical protein
MADTTVMDKLVSLCKRRGFVFQSPRSPAGSAPCGITDHSA